MEDRADLNSMLPFLPIVLRPSSGLFWPSQTLDIFKSLSRGPLHSRLVSGDLLSAAISDLRRSLSLSPDSLARFALQGYSLFFDQLISGEESCKWFEEVVPAMADLMLRLPLLLESHYRNSDSVVDGVGAGFGLRILDSQEAGTVLLSQELIGALLGCSFFCLFPISSRGRKHLPTINFDYLFAGLCAGSNQSQKSKIKCLIHYFEKICANMPVGSVSFERKVLPREHHPMCVSYPDADFWSSSSVPLCQFEAHCSGLIEDQPREALEVDFANEYFGGGALHRGCVQEEIRFMINPELIAGMLFLPALDANESIEVVGSERFSKYTGYASSFCFIGDYEDKSDVDALGRRKTRIVAIDALCCPGMGQFRLKNLVRECNKAFCGFIDQSNYQRYARQFFKNGHWQGKHDQDVENHNNEVNVATSASTKTCGGKYAKPSVETSDRFIVDDNKIGVATGNWGCGAFGGDPELKTILQWLAASQALRPLVSYYTFGEPALRNIDEVTQWIISHEWAVGDLWNMVIEYSWQRIEGRLNVGFFTWLLPSLPCLQYRLL